MRASTAPLSLPVTMVSAVAFSSAAVAAIRPSSLPLGSRWRIPRTWRGLGPTKYAAVFGFILGMGVLTAIPSISFLTLLVWCTSAPAWRDVLLVFVAFGASRSLPLAIATVRANRRNEIGLVDRVAMSVQRLAALEVVVLTLVGLLLLLA